MGSNILRSRGYEWIGGYIFGKNSEGSFNAEDIGLNNDGAVEAAQYIEQFYKKWSIPKRYYR